MSTFRRLFLVVFPFFLVLTPHLYAQKITVESADPAFTEQGTRNLNVTIRGKGFKNGAGARFFVAGTSDPGGVVVKSTSFVDSSTLVSNVEVEADAVVSSFDIEIYLSNGRTGKGIEKFAVTAAGSAEIAFLDSGNALMVTDLDGNIQELFSQSWDGFWISNPDWSPAGDRIVFDSTLEDGWGVWAIDSDGQNLVKLSSESGALLSALEWSPDGRWIAYRGLNPIDETEAELFLLDVECAESRGSSCTWYFETPGIREYSPTWSPTGEEIAVKALLEDATMPSWEILIYSFSTDGSTGYPILGPAEILTAGTTLSKPDVGPSNLLKPSWSKETDHWIAVVDQDEDSNRRLVLINRYDRQIVDLTENCPECRDGVSNPDWSPCNSKLIVSVRDPGNRKNDASPTLGILTLSFDGQPSLTSFTPMKRNRKNSSLGTPTWRPGVCEEP